MNKIILSVLLIFLLLFTSIFFIPINYFLNKFLPSTNQFKIEYSYLEGNIFSGSILDLYVNNNFLGDYAYESKLNLDGINIFFKATDGKVVEGNFIKTTNSGSFNNFSLTDLKVEEELSTDLIKGIYVKFNIDRVLVESLECKSIEGLLEISSPNIEEKLTGKLSCREGNTIIADLINQKNMKLGRVQYFNSSIKVSISTKIIPDRRVRLLTDEISFTVDL